MTEKQETILREFKNLPPHLQLVFLWYLKLKARRFKMALFGASYVSSLYGLAFLFHPDSTMLWVAVIGVSIAIAQQLEAFVYVITRRFVDIISSSACD